MTTLLEEIVTIGFEVSRIKGCHDFKKAHEFQQEHDSDGWRIPSLSEAKTIRANQQVQAALEEDPNISPFFWTDDGSTVISQTSMKKAGYGGHQLLLIRTKK